MLIATFREFSCISSPLKLPLDRQPDGLLHRCSLLSRQKGGLNGQTGYCLEKLACDGGVNAAPPSADPQTGLGAGVCDESQQDVRIGDEGGNAGL